LKILSHRQKKRPDAVTPGQIKNNQTDGVIMMESQSKVNPIIIELLKKVERLFRIKARIVDAINAKIQVERDKIASLEKVEKA
jgi:tRNA (Thr-GGU) A37 N-methylase